jgi:hypothetical protein
VCTKGDIGIVRFVLAELAAGPVVVPGRGVEDLEVIG